MSKKLAIYVSKRRKCIYSRPCSRKKTSFLKLTVDIIIRSAHKFFKMEISHTTDKDFEQDVILSDIPVLIDFWAEWCGPCKMIGPVLEELATELNGKIKIVKVNVDDNNQTAVKFSIRSIPTLMMIKDGQVQQQHIGAASKSQIKEFINQNI